MQRMHQFLVDLVNISEEDWRYFSSHFEEKLFPKKAHIIRAGDVENYLYFVDSGIARFYREDADGNQITSGFSWEGWFMCVFSSFITRDPSRLYGETATEMRSWRIHYNDMQKLYNELKVVERIGRLGAEQMLLIKSEREYALLAKTAEERYLDLVSKAPHLFRHIALKDLASFIGVTPQALSRIRKRIS